jgi:hypothetical protein
MKSHRNVLWEMLVVLACAHATSATAQVQGGVPSPRPGLDPGRAESIRVLGRAVLSAKHGEPADPETEALLRDLDALRAAIADRLRPASGTVSLAPADGAEGETPSAGRDPRDTAVRAAARGLETRSAGLRHRAVRLYPATSPRTSPQAVADTAARLARETEEALDAPPADRHARLEGLHRRLARRSMQEAAPPVPATPTLATRVRHRGAGER